MTTVTPAVPATTQPSDSLKETPRTACPLGETVLRADEILAPNTWQRDPSKLFSRVSDHYLVDEDGFVAELVKLLCWLVFLWFFHLLATVWTHLAGLAQQSLRPEPFLWLVLVALRWPQESARTAPHGLSDQIQARSNPQAKSPKCCKRGQSNMLSRRVRPCGEQALFLFVFLYSGQTRTRLFRRGLSRPRPWR